MDKKNTILLTVIAVATLLVAVVGATFAYFSVTVTGSGSSTTIKASTGEIGTVTVTNNSNELNLLLTAADMAKPEEDDIKYYAINGTSDNEGTATGGKWKKNVAPGLVVSTIALTGVADNDTVSCSVSAQVDLSGTMVGNLKEEDAFLSLSGIEGFEGASDLDLKTAFELKGNGDSESATKTFTKIGKLDLKKGSLSATLKADVWIVNKKSSGGDALEDTGLQNSIAGKSLDVKITTQVSDCRTTSAAGE